jgi:hypothetical protein
MVENVGDCAMGVNRQTELMMVPGHDTDWFTSFPARHCWKSQFSDVLDVTFVSLYESRGRDHHNPPASFAACGPARFSA